MKKVVSLVAALGLGFVVATAGASAQTAQQCYITNTGPGSTNTCTNAETLSCQVLNNTIISINNNNVQQSTIGTGSGSNNTSVTYVSTGPATNTNSAAVSGTIVNGGCVPTVTETPGQGSGATETVAATPAPATVLPKTGVSASLKAAGIVVAVLAVVAVASRMAVAAFAHKA